MRIRSVVMTCLFVLPAGLLVTAPSASATTTSYSTPGTYSFVVPAGATCLSVDALGAGGGGSSGLGGSGARVRAYFVVTAGDTLTIGVGSGGGSGGGGGGGGGLTRLHSDGTALIIAGGGGGGGVWNAGSGGSGAAYGTSAGGDGTDVTPGDGSAGLGGHDGIGGAGGSTSSGLYVASSGGSVNGGNGVFHPSFGPGSTGAIDIQGGTYQNGTGSAGGGAGHGGGGGSSWAIADGTAGAGGSLGPVGASFSPGSNGGAAGLSGGDGSLSLEVWTGECSMASAAARGSLVTLSIASQAGGAHCAGGSLMGYRGTWITLPASTQCTPSDATAPRESRLLGWATTAHFPVARAQDQVDRHWGAIDEQVNGMRMIFIPAGMSVLLSSDNVVYPIWA